jgi:dTDP-glucose 4,6-dehydratase
MNSKQPAWLVTGGAGFIGANFARQALERTDARLVILDALTYAGDLSRLEDVRRHERFTFVRGDICDGALLERLFGEQAVTRVVHFAAETHVDRSILGADAFVRTNVLGTHALLEAARRAWKEAAGRLFLHVSTDEVFGALAPDEAPFNEDSPYRPNSPYAASKAAADHLARAWQQTYGLPTVVTHASNNYGPWQFPEKLLPLMILNALEGRELPVYGDGLQVRDWLSVEDHVEALLAVLARGQPGRSYVIGGGQQRANIDLVRQVCEIVDRLEARPAGASARLIRHVTDRPGHDRRYALDSRRLRAELGWQPRGSLAQDLPALVEWYRQHKAWADAVRSGEYRRYYRQQYGTR